MKNLGIFGIDISVQTVSNSDGYVMCLVIGSGDQFFFERHQNVKPNRETLKNLIDTLV